MGKKLDKAGTVAFVAGAGSGVDFHPHPQRTSVIVRYIDDRTLLIRQPDHARVAGEVIAHCTALKRHPRRESILRAVTHHDDGWGVEDDRPVLDPGTGEVADFVRARTEVRQGVWPRTVGALAEEDPWAAALVAEHAITVYGRLRANPDWHSFFAKMTTIRDALLKKAGRKPLDLDTDYVFVRLGDLISLAFCTGSSDLNQFGGYRVELFRDQVLVSPDPFGGVEIPVEVSAIELAQRKFASDDQLLDALESATPATIVGTVRHA